MHILHDTHNSKGKGKVQVYICKINVLLLVLVSLNDIPVTSKCNSTCNSNKCTDMYMFMYV